MPREAHGTVVQLAEPHARIRTRARNSSRTSPRTAPNMHPRWWVDPAPADGATGALRRVVLRTPTSPSALGFFAACCTATSIDEADDWRRSRLAARRAPSPRGATRRAARRRPPRGRRASPTPWTRHRDPVRARVADRDRRRAQPCVAHEARARRRAPLDRRARAARRARVTSARRRGGMRAIGDRAQHALDRRDRGLGQDRHPGAGRDEIGDEPDTFDLDRHAQRRRARRARRPRPRRAAGCPTGGRINGCSASVGERAPARPPPSVERGRQRARRAPRRAGARRASRVSRTGSVTTALASSRSRDLDRQPLRRTLGEPQRHARARPVRISATSGGTSTRLTVPTTPSVACPVSSPCSIDRSLCSASSSLRIARARSSTRHAELGRASCPAGPARAAARRARLRAGGRAPRRSTAPCGGGRRRR